VRVTINFPLQLQTKCLTYHRLPYWITIPTSDKLLTNYANSLKVIVPRCKDKMSTWLLHCSTPQ